MVERSKKRKHSRAFGTRDTICAALLAFNVLPTTGAEQHAVLRRSLPPAHMRDPIAVELIKAATTTAVRPGSTATAGAIALKITNNCTEIVYPGISTQHGSAPGTHGFKLDPGTNKTVYVSRDWQGRIWGRTNCTFDGGSRVKACGTGDCGGQEDCLISGVPPVTLAEFTLQGNANKAFYDISLVDGFNIGMAIRLVANGLSQLATLPPNKTNPVCVASVADFIANFMPYAKGSTYLGTDMHTPLPLENTTTQSAVARWCPWDLQVSPPEKPANGVYPYPDDKIQRPVFQPCYSACAKFGRDSDCCTGSHATPDSCGPSSYSQAAKKVCPDAYTYAYDDQDSTFTTASGAGFEIILCPSGRSSNILASMPKLPGSTATKDTNAHGKSVQLGHSENALLLGKRKTSSGGAAFGESSTPPWVLVTGAALLVTACVFSTL